MDVAGGHFDAHIWLFVAIKLPLVRSKQASTNGSTALQVERTLAPLASFRESRRGCQ